MCGGWAGVCFQVKVSLFKFVLEWQKVPLSKLFEGHPERNHPVFGVRITPSWTICRTTSTCKSSAGLRLDDCIFSALHESLFDGLLTRAPTGSMFSVSRQVVSSKTALLNESCFFLDAGVFKSLQTSCETSSPQNIVLAARRAPLGHKQGPVVLQMLGVPARSSSMARQSPPSPQRGGERAEGEGCLCMFSVCCFLV